MCTCRRLRLCLGHVPALSRPRQRLLDSSDMLPMNIVQNPAAHVGMALALFYNCVGVCVDVVVTVEFIVIT
jgi:hypothetical protein